MNAFELEQRMNGVVALMANPAVPEGLEERLLERSFAMELTGDELVFGSLDGVGGHETRKTVWGALALHAAAIVLVMLQVRAMHERAVAPMTVESEVLLSAPPVRPVLPPSAKAAGGGGGHVGAAPVSNGTPPKLAERQILPLQIHPVEDAKLPVETRVVVQPELRMAKTDLPQLGMPNAPNVGMSLGNGRGTGIGSGDGFGIGSGMNGNMGGGLRRIGGSVAKPEVLYAPEPEFSDEARKAKVSGNVTVYLQVDEQGRPMHVRVLKGIGLGLDEKAVEAVRQYRFKPARENGVPVAVEMQVDVNFQIF